VPGQLLRFELPFGHVLSEDGYDLRRVRKASGRMNIDDHPWVKRHEKKIKVVCMILIAAMGFYLVYLDTVRSP
jgi:hypothetical protein